MKNKIKLTAIPALAIITGSFVGCASHTIQPVAPTGSGSWGQSGKP